MNCQVCNHAQRTEIEQELLCRNWGDSKTSLDAIADKYGVSLKALQVHSVMHLPVQSVASDAVSITDKIKLNEGDLLRQVANEYFFTLRNVGMKVNDIVSSSDASQLKLINSSLVELYLGCGAKVNESVAGLVKLNQAQNGDKNSGLEALAQLVSGLHQQVNDNDTVG